MSLLNGDPELAHAIGILAASIAVGCIAVGLGLEMVAERFAPRSRRRIQ